MITKVLRQLAKAVADENLRGPIDIQVEPDLLRRLFFEGPKRFDGEFSPLDTYQFFFEGIAINVSQR